MLIPKFLQQNIELDLRFCRGIALNIISHRYSIGYGKSVCFSSQRSLVQIPIEEDCGKRNRIV